MPELDQISEAIGHLRGDVRNLGEKIDHLHTDLCPRVRSLEEYKAEKSGALMVIGGLGGAVSGSAITLAGRWLASKLGL